MKLCISLDLPSKDENIKLVKSIKENNDIWVKIGLRSYIRDGKNFIEDIKKINSNFKIFLDLKLYDIPNTMADTAEEIAKLGIDMFNVHASAGAEAMKTVMERLNKLESRPIVLAVTALTSFNDSEFKEIYNKNLNSCVLDFAQLSYKCGVDGVVCSVYESRSIKNMTHSNFITLTPGIRPFGEDSDDQKRVATIEVAKENLSDYIIVGRPIYKDSNPSKKITNILKKLQDFK